MDATTEGYHPSEDEEYMNPTQLNYFQNCLLTWRRELLQASMDIFSELRENQYRNADPLDVGSQYAESERSLIARNTRNSCIKDIDNALRRIKDGTYGFCEMTGNEIGLKRLAVMPLATLCVEAQQHLERMPAPSLF